MAVSIWVSCSRKDSRQEQSRTAFGLDKSSLARAPEEAIEVVFVRKCSSESLKRQDEARALVTAWRLETSGRRSAHEMAGSPSSCGHHEEERARALRHLDHFFKRWSEVGPASRGGDLRESRSESEAAGRWRPLAWWARSPGE